MAARWYAGAALYVGATWATYSYMTRKRPPLEPSEDTATFDQLAGLYDDKVGTEETFMLYGLLRWWVLRKVKGDVLEISAGTGRNLPYYDLSTITSLTLTDLSKPMLEKAEDKYYDTLRLNFKHPQQQVAFEVADAHCLLHDHTTPPPPAKPTPSTSAAMSAPLTSTLPAPTPATTSGPLPPEPKPSWFSNIWRPSQSDSHLAPFTPSSSMPVPSPTPTPTAPSTPTAAPTTAPPPPPPSPFSQVWKSPRTLTASPTPAPQSLPTPAQAPQSLPTSTPPSTLVNDPQEPPNPPETPPHEPPSGIRIQLQFSLPPITPHQQQSQTPTSASTTSRTASTSPQQQAATALPPTPTPPISPSRPSTATPTTPPQPTRPPTPTTTPSSDANSVPLASVLAPSCQCHQRHPQGDPIPGVSDSWAGRCSEGASGGHALSKFPAASFDYVVDTFGLCSHEDPVVVLREVARVCRPGGQIVLLEHGRSSYDWLNRQLDEAAEAHHRRWGCWWNRDILDVVKQAGLRVDSVSRWHFGTTYVIRAVPGAAADETRSRQ